MRASAGELDAAARRAGRQLLLASSMTLATVALAVVVPKDMTTAADSRFVMTAGTLGLIGIGLSASYAALARWRMARRQRQAERGPRAARDTLSHLAYERRLAWRGIPTCLAASGGCGALYILAHWPQAALLASLQSALGAASLACLALAPALALRNRGHFINIVFLKRYLRQQREHAEGGMSSVPALRLFDRRSEKPAFETSGELQFAISGQEFRFADFVTNAVVLGQIGSGKTVCVLNTLLDALLASSTSEDKDGSYKIAGLVLDAKGDFHGKLGGLGEQYGRAADLVVLDPDAWSDHGETNAAIAWNPLDNDDDALEVSTRLVAVLRMLGLETGNEGSFFLDSARIFLRHAIELVRAGRLTPAPSIVDVHRLCQEGEEETPVYHAIIAGIAEQFSGDAPQPILDAIAYFEGEWRQMADKQRSGVVSTVTQLLDEFLVHPYRDMFTRPSTVSIADCIDEGRILYVHMPAAERERMSRVVTTLIKLEFQRQILKRPRKARPSFMLCDEFQSFYTSGEGRGDSDFFERSRESHHANIVATQNIRAFLKRVRNEHDVRNFLGHCAIKVFLRNTDEATNLWASSLFATRTEITVTANEPAAFNNGGMRRSQTNYGRASQALPVVPPEAFMRLAIPVRDDPQRQHAASIIHLASRGSIEHVELDWRVHPLG
ncbi:MAG: type IV secretory system conjugative DNA transfer family protein [Rhodoblastus sp.]|nr:type IV secretory system conjugative DNA transfer family protein [Rhodoblastus sp.]